MNQSTFEQLKKAKEISDITSERDKVQRLLNSGCWEELNEYLHELKGKYMVETTIYNAVTPFPPTTLEENARNWIIFLDKLLAAKVAESAIK